MRQAASTQHRPRLPQVERDDIHNFGDAASSHIGKVPKERMVANGLSMEAILLKVQ